MARYIDADALMEMLNKKAQTDLEMGLYNHGTLTQSFIRFVERQPTADVAPRAEVAREIFDEIENLLSANMSGELRGDSIEWFDYFDLHLAEDIAELKNEYTEAEPPKGD